MTNQEKIDLLEVLTRLVNNYAQSCEVQDAASKLLLKVLNTFEV